jgi:hypothetical protein
MACTTCWDWKIRSAMRTPRPPKGREDVIPFRLSPVVRTVGFQATDVLRRPWGRSCRVGRRRRVRGKHRLTDRRLTSRQALQAFDDRVCSGVVESPASVNLRRTSKTGQLGPFGSLRCRKPANTVTKQLSMRSLLVRASNTAALVPGATFDS